MPARRASTTAPTRCTSRRWRGACSRPTPAAARATTSAPAKAPRMAPDELALKLAAAWRRQRGEDVAVENLARLSAGASAQSWRFEAAGPRGRDKLVLQLYAGGENFVAALSKTMQARVQGLAGAAGVRTPPVALVVGPDDGL